jgi:putative ABC transport system substrate-binding protein
MKRREFVAAVGGAALAWPLMGAAQQVRMPTVGVLALGNAEPYWTLLREGLSELGLADGKNIRLDLKSAQGKPAALADLAADLVRIKVAAIVTIQTPAALAAKAATKAIPIVMSPAGDPVGTGLIASLARPGGNITGVSGTSSEAAGKTLEIMREMLPSARRIAALVLAADSFAKPFLEQVQLAGRALSVHIQPIVVREPGELDSAFATMSKDGINAVIVLASLPRRAIDLALKHRIPAFTSNSALGEAGCLMAYSADLPDLCRKAAGHVDRILKGAKPADLPVQQPTKFQLLINLRSARALGLAVPQSVLVRADKVIE